MFRHYRLVERGVVVQNMKVDIELPPSYSLVLDHVKSFLYNEALMRYFSLQFLYIGFQVRVVQCV